MQQKDTEDTHRPCCRYWTLGPRPSGSSTCWVPSSWSWGTALSSCPAGGDRSSRGDAPGLGHLGPFQRPGSQSRSCFPWFPQTAGSHQEAGRVLSWWSESQWKELFTGPRWTARGPAWENKSNPRPNRHSDLQKRQSLTDREHGQEAWPRVGEWPSAQDSLEARGLGTPSWGHFCGLGAVRQKRMFGTVVFQPPLLVPLPGLGGPWDMETGVRTVLSWEGLAGREQRGQSARLARLTPTSSRACSWPPWEVGPRKASPRRHGNSPSRCGQPGGWRLWPRDGEGSSGVDAWS